MNKNLNKIILSVILLVILILISIFFGKGFMKENSIYLRDFKLSNNGRKMTIYTSIYNSYGYIRTINTEETEDSLYISFYSTFGLLPNSSLGAKDEFEIDLPSNCKNIYFYDKLVLQKEVETNKWEKVVYRDKETKTDVEQSIIFEDDKFAIKNEIDEFGNELKSNGIVFSRNDEIEYHLSKEDALGVIADLIESNKDNIKSIKVEKLLYTNDGDKNLEKEIPVSVITLYGVKLKSPSGTPFAQPLEYDDSNFISKIIIDDATKEIINAFQIYRSR